MHADESSDGVIVPEKRPNKEGLPSAEAVEGRTPAQGERRRDGRRQPTIVVNGNHDIMIPTINCYNLSQRIPQAQLILYPDSGHGALFQFPELFVAHGTMFLDASA